jgi:putative nucleotidyltransferase with HDIG domain
MQFTLMERMWFADFEDDEAEHKAAESLAATVGHLRGVLPVPDVAAKLVSMVNDPDYKTSDISALITTDAGLSSRILRVINSPSYSLRSECKSISHAVVLLGAKTVRETAVALSLLGVFDDKTGYGEKLLQHSSTVGALANKLATRVSQLYDIDVYSCALLHDIGKLLQLQADESYVELLKSCDGADQVHEKERERYGYDHAVLAGHVLAGWNIPEPLPTAIAWHHKPQRAIEANDQTTAIVAAVRIADKLAYALTSGDVSMEETIRTVVQDPCAEYLGLSLADLQDLWPDLVDICHDEDLSFAA